MSAATQVVQAQQRQDQCVVTLQGEIDMSNADHVREVAVAVITSCTASEIVLDLAGVSFIDSTGLGALVAIRRAGNERGIPTRAVGLQPRTRRLFETVGLDRLFHVADVAE